MIGSIHHTGRSFIFKSLMDFWKQWETLPAGWSSKLAAEQTVVALWGLNGLSSRECIFGGTVSSNIKSNTIDLLHKRTVIKKAPQTWSVCSVQWCISMLSRQNIFYCMSWTQRAPVSAGTCVQSGIFLSTKGIFSFMFCILMYFGGSLQW